MVVDLWMLDKKEQEKVTLLTELANSDENDFAGVRIDGPFGLVKVQGT